MTVRTVSISRSSPLPYPSERAAAGIRLTAEERQLFDAHPATAARLIRDVPRLERVAEIVARQRSSVASGDILVDRGVELLRAAIELDLALARDVPLATAIDDLTSHRVPAEVVAALEAHARRAAAQVPRAVSVAELVAGQVLERDVVSPIGAVVVCAGIELSAALIERLQRFAGGTGIVEPVYVRAS